MTVEVFLRATTPEDRALLLQIYASSRDREMALLSWGDADKAAFLEEQFTLQDRHYRQAFAGAECSIILAGSTGAGRLIVHRGREWIEVMDIALLPPFRNQGIGTFLIRCLMDEARGSGRAIRLWVEQGNPVRRLYDRLGFSPSGDHSIHQELVYLPPGFQPNTAS